jgi:N-formylglutamate amidohydrolase
MTGEHPDWLVVERRDATLIVSIPHAGTDLLRFEPAFVSPWLARKDADWRLDELYDFVEPLGATLVRTRLSRSIIDVNQIQAALRSIPVKRRRNSSQPRPLMASRFIGPAEPRTQQKSPSADVFTSTPIMRRSPARSRASARSTSGWLCSTPTPFGQSSRACSTVN